ncbi:MAG: NAD(P)-dependent oxidoreductase [Chloroflexi bacterium]|nr:NAD(P)-dependent oxidoreductase [Chloroflexota bacterium]
MSQQKVLITGMSGLIGGIARRHLESQYQLSALNRSFVPGVECHQADIANLEAIQPAFTGKDVVVHLAANASSQSTWEELCQANIIGTYNVFEAARRAGVRRVIFASSGMAIAGYEQIFPYNALVEGRYDEVPGGWPKITHQSPTWPKGLYGCSKVWGEALAHQFADTTGLSTICLRICAVSKENRPTSTREFSIWCSHRDIAQMIDRCIAAPESLHFDILFAMSNNKWGYRDIEHAREVVGFVPQDAAEDYR